MHVLISLIFVIVFGGLFFLGLLRLIWELSTIHAPRLFGRHIRQ
jgi:hypothetical protein